MRAFVLVALLALSSLARAADDAPVAVSMVPDVERECVPKPQRINEGKAMASCLATNESLTKGNVIMPTGAFIGTIGGAVLIAIAGGIAIGVAASGKKP